MSALTATRPAPALPLEVLARTIVEGIEAVRSDLDTEHRITVVGRVPLSCGPSVRVDANTFRGYVTVDDAWTSYMLTWQVQR